MAILVLKKCYMKKELRKLIQIIHILIRIIYFLTSIFFLVYRTFCFYVLHVAARSANKTLRKKWVDDLQNLNLFIERVEKRDRTINPCYFVDDSESHFEKLFYGKLKKKIF